MSLGPRPHRCVLIVNMDEVLYDRIDMSGAGRRERSVQTYGEDASGIRGGLCTSSMLNLQRVLALSGAGQPRAMSQSLLDTEEGVCHRGGACVRKWAREGTHHLCAQCVHPHVLAALGVEHLFRSSSIAYTERQSKE